MFKLLPCAREALEILSPAFENLFGYSEGGGRGFHFVILDPAFERWSVKVGMENAVLLDGFLGENDGKHDYRKIALSKAEQAWMVGLPNAFVQSFAPALLREEDTPFAGSFVYNGLVVAVSGLRPWFDELVSMWIACTIQQVCKHYRQRWITQHPTEDFFS
jgi:hypothetical protein